MKHKKFFAFFIIFAFTCILSISQLSVKVATLPNSRLISTKRTDFPDGSYSIEKVYVQPQGNSSMLKATKRKGTSTF